ncbi:MAG: type II secretion system protein [Candidatus Omnitrophica bacterium]|nr:type II secretion system protein [Candidatus Omnitrophota bacterium]
MTGKKSFTLIELVMVMVIVGIIAGIGVPVILTTADAWSLASFFQDNAVSQAIVAQSRMSREIRRLLNDASVAGASSTQYSFTDLGSNVITYNRSGNTLMRNSDGLAANVTALSFIYYDDDNNTITTPVVSPDDTDIRIVQGNFSILAGSNTLNFRFATRPQNLRRLNEKFK